MGLPLTIAVLTRIAIILLWLVALVFVLLTVIGTLRYYSPVPFWDMWNGYLRFYLQATDGNWAIWFAQHNEHRIPLAKLFFWLDIRYAGGKSILLIISNFCCMAGLWLTLSVTAKKLLPKLAIPIVAVLAIWCFSWLQKGNIVWGFQIQAFLAFLLPLWSFLLLASINNTAVWRFNLVTGLGIVSAFTMANGLLTLPLMVAMAMLMQQSTRRILTLLLAACVVILLYSYGYKNPPGHSTLIGSLLHPIQSMAFILVYLGLPIYGFSEQMLLAGVLGIGYLIATISCVYWWLRKKVVTPLFLGLLMFAIYIVLTAILTAIGRSGMGMENALQTRYTTPVLLGWCCLGILFAVRFQLARYFYLAFWLIAFMSIAMLLPAQLRVLNTNLAAEKQTKWLATLALVLGVDDQAVIETLDESMESVKFVARQARARDLSIFTDPRIYNVSAKLGQPISIITAETCQATIDAMLLVDAQHQGFRVTGWAYTDASIPQHIWFSNAAGRIVGVALTGMPQRDLQVKRRMYGQYYLAGFSGYVLGRVQRDELRLVCEREISRGWQSY